MKFGFKQIKEDNLLTPDSIMDSFVIKTSNGQFRPVAVDDFLNMILAPKLSESVPEEVQALFEVARGAMAYGYYFYPLFTLAMEQLFRVAEAAVTHKYLQEGGKNEKIKFIEKIDFLVGKKIIKEEYRYRWDALRKLRNMGSHPLMQSILPPGMAINELKNIATMINSLYPNHLNFS